MFLGAGRSFSSVLAAVLLMAVLFIPESGASAAVANPGCATALLSAPAPAETVLTSNSRAFGAAAQVNGRSLKAFTALARDRTFWLDQCGRGLYVEPGLSASEKAPSAEGPTAAATLPVAAAAVPAATAMQPLTNTFLLESRPGSTKTIYLDFRGGTVTGTAWNNTYGASITVDPYSMDEFVDTNFSNAELTEIQKIWQIIAEDYAPFDVNVTTRDLGVAAIDRTDSADAVYGTRVAFTGGGPVYTGCGGCGGIAYIDVFNFVNPSHMFYQPAFVFTNGVGVYAKNLGEAGSHEAGHNLSLYHDGNATFNYDFGSGVWAPIMGAGYYGPVSQWSKGEYPQATNTQDDLAVISGGTPFRVDDHGDSRGTATPLSDVMPVNGVIGNRTDVDAFSFTASGDTTVSVTVADYADLDAQLQIADSSGSVIATVDPPSAVSSYSVATGLSATWTATLPSSPATYTAFVDGVGNGTAPLSLGQYTDYASLGNYQIALTTVVATPPSNVALPAITGFPVVGQSLSASTGTWSGSPTGYTYQWQRGTADISGATSSSYTVAPGDVGSTLRVKVTATNSYGSTTATSLSTGTARAALSASATTPASAVVGSPYSATPVAASGGITPYSWSAIGLPGTLSMSSSGTITGTPTATGTYPVTATVTDVTSATATTSFTLTVGPAALVLTATTPPVGYAGTAYSATPLTATGGTTPYRFTATGLPTGISISSTTGALSGTPSKSGTFTVTATVTDALSVKASRSFALVVNAALAFTTNATLSSATVGRSYSTNISVTGGLAPYSWSLTTGAVPPGLALTLSADKKTQTLAGSPTTKGSYSFTFVVTDARGVSVTRQFSITVK